MKFDVLKSGWGMFFKQLPLSWSRATALPSQRKSNCGTKGIASISFRISQGNVPSVIDSITLPANAEVTLYACNVQLLIPDNVPALPLLASTVRGIILQMTRVVHPIFGKFNFRNIKVKITLPFKMLGVSFKPRTSLWRLSMLQLRLVLLRRRLLGPNWNQQFLSFLLNLQRPLRRCLTKCSLQSIHSWDRSPRLWWLWSRKYTEVKYLSNRWLISSQLWLILPKSSSFQRNIVLPWTFLAKSHLLRIIQFLWRSLPSLPLICQMDNSGLFVLIVLTGLQPGLSSRYLFLFFVILLLMVSSPLLVQWNMRSYRSNGHWLRTSHALQAQIMCLQETFLQPSDVVSLSPWCTYRADRQHSRGGGLLTAVSPSIPSYSVRLPPCPEASIEALGVSVFLNHEWHIILNIYSPSGIFPADWLSDLITSFDEPFIIVGDFNINMLSGHLPPSPRALNLMNWLDSQDLCCLNLDIPTRSGPGGQSSLLDLTFLPPSLCNKITFYVHPDPYDSDHHPIILLTHCSDTSSHSSSLPRWNLAAQSFNNTALQHLPSYQAFTQACIHAIKSTKVIRSWRARPLRP